MNHNNQIDVPTHLWDHDYVGTANHIDEKGKVVGILGHLKDHNYTHQPLVFEIDNLHENERVAREVLFKQPETYRRVPGVQRNSTIYVDNVGFKYYKREALINTISLVCVRQKNPCRSKCFGTASISINMMDNRFTIRKPHNHLPDEIDLHTQLLKVDSTNQVQQAPMQTIYDNEIAQ